MRYHKKNEINVSFYLYWDPKSNKKSCCNNEFVSQNRLNSATIHM